MADSRLHARYKTPINSILFVAAVTLVIDISSQIGAGIQEAFQLVDNAANVFYGIVYAMMFAIPLVGASVQNFDSFLGQHAHEFHLTVALIVVVAKHSNHRQAQPHQHVQQRLHFIRTPEICKVASQHKHVGFVTNANAPCESPWCQSSSIVNICTGM